MTLRNFLDEARAKGEVLKSEIATELLNSRVLHDIVRSDLFSKAVTTVVKTKDEVTRVIRHNVKNVLDIMDVPSRNDLVHLQNKLSQLEKSVDRMGKKAITVKSLRTINLKKAVAHKH